MRFVRGHLIEYCITDLVNLQVSFYFYFFNAMGRKTKVNNNEKNCLAVL